MTPYQQKVLDHLVNMALLDKQYAWWASKNYAEIDRAELWAMPELLTKTMKARNDRPTTLA